MEDNIGAVERRTRLVVGVVLGAVGLASLGGLLGVGATAGTVLTLLGVVLVATGFVRVCLLYRLLGVNTSWGR